MYRMTVRQLVLLAIFSASFAGMIVAIYDRYGRSVEIPVTATTNAMPQPADAGKKSEVPISSDEQNNIQVYSNMSPGVVNITNTSYVEGFWGLDVYPQQGTGSGSVIDKQGHILTNFHVIQNAQQLQVTLQDKNTYDARIVGSDPDNDLAVIQIKAPEDQLHVVPLGTSQGLHVGQKVLAIGNPFGLQSTLTQGIISGLGRPLKTGNGRTVENVIQTDASINPGNSGGPLLNANGELIGVNTAIYSPSGGSVGIGFAVPVDNAKRIIPDLINYGRVLRPWLGISSQPITPQLAAALDAGVKEGLIITNIIPNSPASHAGIRASERASRRGNLYHIDGDIIIKIGDQPIRNQEDLYKVLNNYKPNDTVKIEVNRNGQVVNIDVKLEATPAHVNDNNP